MQRGLTHLRVLDFSTGIATGYACKLLSDAGADVVKVEPPAGDPLRRWSATGAQLAGDDGPLFAFLHHGVRAVVGRPQDPEIEALIGDADLVVDNAVPALVDEATLRAVHPRLVVLSVTPFGRTGPYAGRPATEFTVQAESGCIAARGQPDRPPLMAGGRIGEWVTGTYAAAAATAAIWRAGRTGRGAHVDVSMLELLNVAGTSYMDLTWSLFGRPSLERAGPARAIETPSIEPTSDGWVGFTTNSRQQFDDFLVLIERPDLIGDEQLARLAGRLKRLDEWNAIVRTWTRRHTTAEVIGRATELRIPVAPIGNGATLTAIDHFVARGVFLESPDGRFRMPRRPWRINGVDPPSPRTAPRLGEHTGRIEMRTSARSGRRSHDDAEPPGARPELPLTGLLLLDLTAWWAGPAAAHLLATLGADVIHVESIRRLDGMRMTGGIHHGRPQWWERSSVFLAANTNKRGLALDLSTPAGLAVAKRLIARCDVVLENFTPRVMDNFGLGWDVLHELNPNLIYVRMPAFGLTGPWRDRTGFAQTMEQLTGLAWLTGHADDQPRIQRGPSDPNAGVHAAFAVLVALAEREATRSGHHLEVTMIEAALNAAAEQLVEFTAFGRLLAREGNRAPNGAPQNLYQCVGDDQWMALAVETDLQWEALVEVLGRPEWTQDAELGSHGGRRRRSDDVDAHLAKWARLHEVHEAVTLLVSAGVPAGVVVDPRATAAHPQLVARGFYEELDHPVVGRHLVPSVPFRYSDVDRWLRSPAPTVGQHNREVLGEVASMTDDEIDALEAGGVIGSWPIGL